MEHPRDPPPGVDHREIVLMRREQELRRAPERVLGLQGLEAGHHRRLRRQPAHRRPPALKRRLLSRSQEDEDRDQQQHRLHRRREEREDGEQNRHPLADGRRDVGRAVLPEEERERRPQDAAAVHRERGDQVEEGEDQVRHQELPDDRRAAADQLLGRDRRPHLLEDQEDEEGPGENQIDRRARQRDHELRLAGGDAIEARDAADRVEHDLARLDAEPARRGRVAELVEDDAAEEQQQEDDASQEPLSLTRRHGSEPEQQEQEREVDPDRDAERRADAQRPAAGPGRRRVPGGALGFAHRLFLRAVRRVTSRRSSPGSAPRASAAGERSNRGSRARPSRARR